MHLFLLNSSEWCSLFKPMAKLSHLLSNPSFDKAPAKTHLFRRMSHATPQSILAHIRGLSGTEDLSSPATATAAPGLINDGIDEFGTWGNAVRAAGLDFSFKVSFRGVRIRKNRAETVQRLAHWLSEHGFISEQTLQKHTPKLLDELCDAFGSFGNVVQKLGLPTVPEPPSEPEEAPPPKQEKAVPSADLKLGKLSTLILKRHVDKWIKEYGPLCAAGLRDTAPELRDALIERYGGLPIAAKALNVPFETPEEREDGRLEGMICGKLFHLLARHFTARHRISSDEYKQRFGVRQVISSRERNRRTKYSPAQKDLALCELRRLAAEVAPKQLVCAQVMRNGGEAFVMQIRHMFGSWSAALDAAGVTHKPRRQWTRDKVAEALLERVRHGKSMSIQAIQEEDSGLSHAATVQFGSWTAALKHLRNHHGIGIKPLRRTWTKKKVVDALLALTREGTRLSSKSVTEKDLGLALATKRRFGSFTAALEHLRDEYGVDVDVPKHSKKWTRDGLVNALLKRVQQGESLSSGIIQGEDQSLLRAATKYFGSWSATLDFLHDHHGIDIGKRRRSWDKDKVLNALVERIRQGKTLSFEPVYKEDSGLVAAARKYCGAWSAAASAARSIVADDQ